MFCFCHLNIITQSYYERQMFIKNKAKIKIHNLNYLDLSFKGGLKEKKKGGGGGAFLQTFSQVSHFLLKREGFQNKGEIA